MSYTVKIYKIVNNIDDKCYIGSTKQSLSVRFISHKREKVTSHILFRDYGYSNCSIILLEEVEVQSRREQLMLERDYIERDKEHCVNTRVPIRSDEEIKARRQAYRDSHKDYQKEWWEGNRDRLKPLRREKRKAIKNQQPESL